jgi:phosphate transport system substrate-binding protein
VHTFTDDRTTVSTSRRSHEVKRTSFRNAAVPTVAALALGATLSACGAANESGAAAPNSDGPALSGTLNGAGSSAQEAAQGAWQAGFQTKNPDVTVNYDPVGSGGGREQFLAGGVDFAGSDSYLSDEEIAASKKICNGGEAIEVPNYVSPIALVYNLDGVESLQLSAKTAAMIFAGKVTTWDDPAIKAENPDATLPGDRIVPVHRSDESGTTDNFTQWLSAAGQGAWAHEADGVWPVKGGEGAQGTSGVIEAVKNGKGTIGYADESQAGDLSVASIKVGDEYVAPTADAASKVVDVSPRVEGRPENDMAVDIDRTTTEAGAYPLVLVSYVIACPTYADEAKAKLVKNYLTYVLGSDGQTAAAQTAGSAPLSSSFGKDAVAAVEQISAKS